MPPPSVRPATPVEARNPEGVAIPNATVAWSAHVDSGATLAIYMPGFDYEKTASQLIAAGLKPQTPCAIISRASSSGQSIHRTTVDALPSAPHLPAPTLLLVGDAVGVPQMASSEDAWGSSTSSFESLSEQEMVVGSQNPWGDQKEIVQ